MISSPTLKFSNLPSTDHSQKMLYCASGKRVCGCLWLRIEEMEEYFMRYKVTTGEEE